MKEHFAEVALVVLMCCGCSSETQPTPVSGTPASRPRVLTVSYPLAYFAERIGGQSVEVEFPVPHGADPANWNPDGDSIAMFQSADLVLLNGADYAKWTLRATLPWSRTVVTTREVENQYIEIADAVTHTHGPDGEHEHGGIVSETWLDPQLAIAQALVIRQELVKLVPGAEDSISANFDSLKRELQRLDKDFESAFAEFRGPWLASHPVYHYLQRRYSLDVRSLHWEPNEMPSDEQWQEFEQSLESHPSPFMLWEDEPTEEIAERLQQLGVTVVVCRSGDRYPTSGDYMDVMQGNLQRIRNAVTDRPPTS